jgi:hypothetical protein
VINRRHLRVRVLEALERRAKQFRPREELWPLRVPRDPVALEENIDQAQPEGHPGFDPITLRSRTLLHLEWEDGCTWAAWVIVLPSGLKLYCDSGEEESRLLASGGKNPGDESDRVFLELLSESAGQHFGIEMSGGAPCRVRSSIADRAFLRDVFVSLFEMTGTEDSLRAQLADRAPHHLSEGEPQGSDFRVDVERWLIDALPAR